MNLSKLFEMQRKLDERIIEEKGLQDQTLLDKKILALQVELGELAQNWRGFKYWSNDQAPRIGIPSVHYDENLGHDVVEYVGPNPLLEEYVDCLHFLLSIGLESEIGTFTGDELMPIKMGTIEMQFITLFKVTVTFLEDISYYQEMWELFLGLGEMLGFTPEQVESAYYEKNAENHRRQEVGY